MILKSAKVHGEKRCNYLQSAGHLQTKRSGAGKLVTRSDREAQ